MEVAVLGETRREEYRFFLLFLLCFGTKVTVGMRWAPWQTCLLTVGRRMVAVTRPKAEQLSSLWRKEPLKVPVSSKVSAVFP